MIIDGTSSTIEYEDDMTYGELEAILQNCIDLSDMSKPKVDIPKYRFQILLKVLRKAPFNVGDAVAIRNLKNSQANKIMLGGHERLPFTKTSWGRGWRPLQAYRRKKIKNLNLLRLCRRVRLDKRRSR